MCVVLYKYLLLCWFPLSIRVWIITINGAEGTIYAGEKFRLRVAFPEDYPTKPPAVYFLQSPPPPKHQVGKRSPQPCSLKSFKVVTLAVVAIHRPAHATCGCCAPTKISIVSEDRSVLGLIFSGAIWASDW